jgi:hypothetical protein
MHRTSGRFWSLFSNLPDNIQTVARKNFELLKSDPSHPSLHFKKVGNLWSVRAGSNHRALAVQDGPDFIWVWIGAHDEYRRLIKQQS